MFEAIPGFYKLNLMTPMTVMAKDLSTLASQDAIMTEAMHIAKYIGTPQLDNRVVSRLAAVNIGVRDAVQIARLPSYVSEGGNLLLPDLTQWNRTFEGRQSHRKVLDAIHADARRTIVTASNTSDKAPLFQGVLVSPSGEVIGQSELFSLPLQFMGYGVAAMNKVLMAGLQGRDRSLMSGIMGMLILGTVANYFKMGNMAWQNKTYTEMAIDSWEASGIGGFWLGDINLMIERMSGNNLGLRPMFGADPKFGGEDDSFVGATDLLGPALGMVPDMYRAFTDDTISATERAQIIRRMLIYNNVLWWNGLARNIATNTGEIAEEF